MEWLSIAKVTPREASSLPRRQATYANQTRQDMVSVPCQVTRLSYLDG